MRSVPGRAVAGARPGDVIAGVGGQPTPAIADLEALLASYQPGEKVTVEILRDDGDLRRVTVTLGRRRS